MLLMISYRDCHINWKTENVSNKIILLRITSKQNLSASSRLFSSGSFLVKDTATFLVNAYNLIHTKYRKSNRINAEMDF